LLLLTEILHGRQKEVLILFLDVGRVKSLGEVAQTEGMTRARGTLVLNLLKLPVEWQAFRTGLTDPKEVKKYSERKLRYGGSL
jgi:hypothetical protein